MPNNPNPITTDALITLYVDTSRIASGKITDPNLVYLADNQDDPETSNPETFETGLKQNSQIAWFGAVMDINSHPYDYVLITGITMKNDGIGITIRDKFNGRGKSGAGSGNTHIDGIPTSASSTKGASSTYTISFTVRHYPNNADLTNYTDSNCTIDPKLNMN